MAATRTRLKGTKLSLKLDGTEIKSDLVSYKISSEKKDSDVTTFEDMENGNQATYKIELEFVQSLDPDSLWMKMWDHTGETVPYAIAPAGNAVASAKEPHFTGSLTIPNPPELGGAAEDKAYTATVECVLSGKPIKKTS